MDKLDEIAKLLKHKTEEEKRRAVLAWVETEVAEAYKKGHIDGAIEVVNNTCGVCGSYPMTVNCNNAGCDT